MATAVAVAAIVVAAVATVMLQFARLGNDHAVTAVELGPVKRRIGRPQRGAAFPGSEHIGDPGRECHLLDRYFGGAVDQVPVGQLGAQPVELFEGLGHGRVAEQHHEFLTAVARDMAALVGNPRQVVGHQLQHPVPGIVAVGIIDPLEVIDIAEGHAERFGRRPGGAVFRLIAGLEGAAVGQTGQVVFLGAAPGFLQLVLEAAGLLLAALHRPLDLQRALEHGLGDRGQFGDHGAGAGHCLQLASLL